jgi:hypothetical protein
MDKDQYLSDGYHGEDSTPNFHEKQRIYSRMLKSILALVLLTPLGSWAQTTPPPIQVGYVVITPSSPSITPVPALETFTQTRTFDTLQVGVLAPNLATSVLLPLEVSASLSKTLGVAIVNPNSGATQITLTVRRPDGTPFAINTLTVLARQQISRLITELFPGPPTGGAGSQPGIPAEFNGTLVITSTLPASILGLKFRGDNYSTIPAIDIAPGNFPIPVIITGVGGSGAALFPQFVTGGNWSTEITIFNTATTPLTVRVDVFTPTGAPFPVRFNGQIASSFLNLVIPGSGSLILAP